MGVYGVGPPDQEGRLAANAAPAPPLQTHEAARAQEARASREEQVRPAEKHTAPGSNGPRFSRPRLRVDETSKRIIAQLVDESGEVVKQIPPEEMLRLAANFGRLQGLLFDQQA